MNFSLQSPTAPAPAAPPAARDLPELRRPAPRKGRGRKLIALGVVAALGIAAVLVGIPGMSKPLTGLFAASRADVINFEVRRANLPVTVVERGSLESSHNEDVVCEVEGSTTIIFILPEGSNVTKGQLVCELDSAALSDSLVNQRITTQGAESSYLNAKLTREVAEIAVNEYKEGTYKLEMETALGEIALAQSDLKRAEDRLDWSDKMLLKKYISTAANIADQLSLQKSKFGLEQAQSKLRVLKDYTYDKTIKELESEVKKARSDELAKQATWELEKAKEAKLEKQIKNCKLYAPNDGLVVYANDPNRFGGSNAPQVEEGAAVRERQKIFSLPDVTKMRVNTKVHESMINMITPGLRARIRVDAFAETPMTGTVQSVSPMADQSSFFNSDVKVYSTLVPIDKGVPGLRPGMTAEVEILITELKDVLSVPVQAVLEYKGKDHVSVRTPNGYVRKEVALGITNNTHVEIKEGVKPGDYVALNPMALMTAEEKREAFGTSGGEGAKKDWGDGPAATAVGPDGAAVPGVSPVSKGKGAAGKGKGGRGKGKRGGAGAVDPAVKERLKNASPEERQRMIEEFKAANPGLIPGGGGPGGGPNGGGGGFGGGPGS
jgi:RND family efflux transporter MFP subunit